MSAGLAAKDEHYCCNFLHPLLKITSYARKNALPLG